MAADWSEDVIAAVQRWIAVQGGSSGTTTWRDLGPAILRADGWLVLDRRGSGRTTEVFLDPCLAGERGPEHDRAHPVGELRDEDGVLLLRAPAGVTEDSRHVWVRAMSPQFLLDALLQGLRTAGSAPLAQALAEKRLDGAPTSGAEAAGLVGAQVEAFRACLSPGLRLVWGPPGTGPTRVLARAIEELIGQDKRVLLVSSADAAVDDAVHAVVDAMAPPAGTVVRVGPAHRAEIAGDPDVQLERLAARASREADAQRAAVEKRLREFDEVDAQVAQLRAELRDDDGSAYRGGAARLAAERDAAALRPRLRESEAVADAARRTAVTAASDLQEALAARAELDPVRDALEHERRAVEGLAVLEHRQRALQLERRELDARELPFRWRHRRRHRREVEAADVALRRYADAATEGRRRWLDVQLQARAVIGEHSQEEIDRADLRVVVAERALAVADAEYRRSRDVLAGLRSAMERVAARGQPTDEDRRIVADADARGLPARHARLRELVDRQEGAAELRGALEAEHRTLVNRGRRQRAEAEAQLVGEARVVATTLARSRIHPALADAAFDVVLVAEAGAAVLAEVLLALCRATTTAVLFGDVLQPGPVLDAAAEAAAEADTAVQKWVRATCFSHLGIASPADVVARAGCVALTRQFSSGENLRRLANEAGYAVLRAAEDLPDASAQADVVLIDVSSVPDLAVVRRAAAGGRWWTAGTVLSRALAERHLPDGPVGVVTFDAVQAGATLAAVRDRNLIAGAAVGTVHALQSREFATVIVDLGAAGADAVAAREFAVALTGSRGRVYVIADGRAVHAATTGPLRVLRDGVDRGEVSTWSAAALLGAAEPPDDPRFTEVRALLRQGLDAADVHDGHDFGAALDRQLAGARESVVVWAPTADRASAPSLQAATGRGVRVRVVVPPDEQSRHLPELVESGVAVVRVDHGHGGVAVVDERLVLLGSRTADAPGTAREAVLAVDGRAFAGWLLAELEADGAGVSPRCARCGEVMEARRNDERAETQWRCRGCRVGIPEQRSGPLRPSALPSSGSGSS